MAWLDYRFGPETVGWDSGRRAALIRALRRMLREEFPGAKLKVVDYGFPLVRIIDLTNVDPELAEAVCQRADVVYFDLMATAESAAQRH
jgi:hypothetical protein